MKLSAPSHEFVVTGKFAEVIEAVDWAFKNCKGNVGVQFCAKEVLPISPMIPHQLVVFGPKMDSSAGLCFDSIEDAALFRTFWGSGS